MQDGCDTVNNKRLKSKQSQGLGESNLSDLISSLEISAKNAILVMDDDKKNQDGDVEMQDESHVTD